MGNPLGVGIVLLNYGLARLFPRSCVRRLVSALSSDDADTRQAAYMALVKLGPKIQSHLLELARSGSQTTGIVQILGDHGDEGAIPALEEFLDHSDPRVSTAAEESLTELRHEGEAS